MESESFFTAFEEADSFFFLESFVRHLKIYHLLARLSLGHDSDTMLDEHDSPQWYDIVHFEHKLSWLCFGLPQSSRSSPKGVDTRRCVSKDAGSKRGGFGGVPVFSLFPEVG